MDKALGHEHADIIIRVQVFGKADSVEITEPASALKEIADSSLKTLFLP